MQTTDRWIARTTPTAVASSLPRTESETSMQKVVKFAAELGGKVFSKLLIYLVDLIGIEPMTSSMPWSRSNRKA
ncbi:MAG: hypothetical protein ABSF70_02540 [Terracidiphilus sp.]|jgi:hypothetical protein